MRIYNDAGAYTTRDAGAGAETTKVAKAVTASSRQPE